MTLWKSNRRSLADHAHKPSVSMWTEEVMHEAAKGFFFLVMMFVGSDWKPCDDVQYLHLTSKPKMSFLFFPYPTIYSETQAEL